VSSRARCCQVVHEAPKDGVGESAFETAQRFEVGLALVALAPVFGAVPVQLAKWCRLRNRRTSPVSARIFAALMGPTPVISSRVVGCAATLALVGGADLKTVSEMLGHSTMTITADTYATVLSEVARRAAEAAARLVPPGN
jgi:hypothetical protein